MHNLNDPTGKYIMWIINSKIALISCRNFEKKLEILVIWNWNNNKN